MVNRIGIIAEDKSDVDVIFALIRKIAKKEVCKEQFVGEGHGRIKAKCRAWAANLQTRGCRLLMIVHDLDSKNETELRTNLKRALDPCPIPLYVIVIPKREIEAWLLADHEAIREALNLRDAVKKIPNPESINRPKEHLRDLIYSKSGRKLTYINTIHNVKIAQKCIVANLKRCSSFVPMAEFVKEHL